MTLRFIIFKYYLFLYSLSCLVLLKAETQFRNLLCLHKSEDTVLRKSFIWGREVRGVAISVLYWFLSSKCLVRCIESHTFLCATDVISSFYYQNMRSLTYSCISPFPRYIFLLQNRSTYLPIYQGFKICFKVLENLYLILYNFLIG